MSEISEIKALSCSLLARGKSESKIASFMELSLKTQDYNVIYARIKHLMFLRENFEILRSETITARKIFKLTNEEFETSYGMSRDGLLNAYPFTTQTLDEIKNWPENKQILNDYEEKRNARSK